MDEPTYPPPRVLSGDDAAALPVNSRYVPCDVNGIPYHNSSVRTVGLAGLAGEPEWALVLHVPRPAPHPEDGR